MAEQTLVALASTSNRVKFSPPGGCNEAVHGHAVEVVSAGESDGSFLHSPSCGINLALRMRVSIFLQLGLGDSGHLIKHKDYFFNFDPMVLFFGFSGSLEGFLKNRQLTWCEH